VKPYLARLSSFARHKNGSRRRFSYIVITIALIPKAPPVCAGLLFLHDSTGQEKK
jgi:hypothetical protein